MFESSGIRRRYGVRPLDWYFSTPGWPDRNDAFIEGAGALFVSAAEKALQAAGLSAGDVDTVVTVTSTDIATPSLEARVSKRLGFRADIERVPVFGLGCAGGVSGFSLASRLAASRPGSVLLLVAVETCTLAFRIDKLTKANIVATALFGEGAAACIAINPVLVWTGFTAMCVGMLTAILDVQVVATSLPTIQSALDINPDQTSWIQTTYLIAEVVAIPSTGFLTRLLTMRWLFVTSLALFVIASAGCAVSGER